jgi:GTP cyclohydrolase I
MTQWMDQPVKVGNDMYEEVGGGVPYEHPAYNHRDDMPFHSTVEEPTKEELVDHHCGQILDNISPGWRDNPHMQRTARRYAKQLIELTSPDPFEFTSFPTADDEMIVLTGIPFYTLCGHHVIPFYGKCHIGYVPNGKIAGLSKFARLVKETSKGLWVQEELTARIAYIISNELNPRGVAVLMEGEHMCMAMRGVRTPGVTTSTAAMKGVFGDHSRTAKAEFLEAVRRGRP